MTALTPQSRQAVGQAINQAARRATFADFLSRKADNTLRQHRASLDSFAQFLATLRIQTDGEALQTTPAAWQGVTWGMVEGFVKWLLAEGYATGTINIKLSAVKVYARLAHKAGALDLDTLTRIRGVQGYRSKEARRIDRHRESTGLDTRIGAKKAAPVRLTPELVDALKDQPRTAHGFLVALLVVLLCDHGLRIGEVADLRRENIDLDDGQMTFYRQKVDKWQRHALSPDAERFLRAYLDGAGHEGPLYLVTVRTLQNWIRKAGERIGVDSLSPHDCRHYWATQAARSGMDVFRLQEAGGWSSLDMPRRYVEEADVANEGWKWSGVDRT